MSRLIEMVSQSIYDFDERYRDRQGDDYFLMTYPKVFFVMVALYYAFVMHIGPKIMEKREAFALRKLLAAYNSLQIALNTYVWLMIAKALFVDRVYSNLLCLERLPERDIYSIKELNFTYIFFGLKILDLADTVFFVLRKNYRQVTFLHVYHHIMMCLVTFVTMRYSPGGHMCYVGLYNSIVHSVMYFYYLATSIRPEMKNSLWWKKYITQMQLVQFVLIFLHNLVPLFSTTCTHSKMLTVLTIFQSFFISVLFMKFYYKTYILKQKSKDSSSQKSVKLQ